MPSSIPVGQIARAENMFASRIDVLLIPIRGVWIWVRARPKSAASMGVCLVLALVAGGMYFSRPLCFQQALQALKEDRLEDAHRFIQDYLQGRPEDARGHFWAARIERLRANLADAERHLDAVKRLEGMTAATQLEWVLWRAQAGDFTYLERDLWERVNQARSDEEIVSILETLAWCYIKDIRYHLAHECLDRWLKREPDNVRALVRRAAVREELGYRTGAHEDYQRVLEFTPERWPVVLRLAQMSLEDKNVKDANRLLEPLQASHGESAEVLTAIGQCRFLEGKFAEARACFDKAIEVNGKSHQALYEKGLLELQEDHPQRAEALFRRALEAFPAFANAKFSLYYALQRQKNKKREAAAGLKAYKDLLADLEKLKKVREQAERFPYNDRLLFQAGEILWRHGLDALAVHYLLRAWDLNPRHTRTNELLAEYYKKMDRPKEAARHLKLAAQSSP